VWRHRRWIRERHARLEAMRRRTDAELIDRFEATVDSPQITSDVARRVAPLLRAYRALAVAAVRAIGR
jgi:hypothetical protein